MKRKKILVILIVSVSLSFYFYSIFLNGFYDRKPTLVTTGKNLQSNAESQNISQIKHVLFYTTFWKNKYWDIGSETVGNEHPHFEKCSAKNCIFTHKKTYLKSFEDYDAIIFHSGRVWTVNGVYWKVPDVRKSNQLYIIAVQE